MSSVEAVHPEKAIFIQEHHILKTGPIPPLALTHSQEPIHVTVMMFNHNPLKSITQNNLGHVGSENEKPSRVTPGMYFFEVFN